MELDNNNSSLSRNNELVNNIVSEVKAQGIFDQFRRECIADVDTKPAFQNLKSRVESEVKYFLEKQVWKPSMNKTQLREQLRKYINDASYLKLGLDKIVDQVVDPNTYTVFLPRVSDVVKEYTNKKKPKEVGLKDLLPEDLEPVSPSSDKDCSKSASLDSSDKIVTDFISEKIEKKITEDTTKDNQENSASKDEKKSSSALDGRSRRTSTSSSRSSHKRSELKKSDSQSNSKMEQDLKSERSSDRSSDRSSENKKSRDKKRSRLSDSHRRSRSHKKSSDTDTSRSLSRKRHLSSDKSSDEKLTKKPRLENSESSKDAEKEESDRDIAAIPDEERVQIVSGDESYGSSPKSEASMTLEDTKKIILNTSVPDEERVQIVSDEDSRDANPNPTMTLEETTKIIFG